MGYYSLDLDQLRQAADGPPKTPFPHQQEAFEALAEAYSLDGVTGSGGLLVLPTGAGKTFTAVSWIAHNVLRRNIKVLWLAHSCYLLDQACEEFIDFAPWIPEPRNSLNIRVISGSPSHNRAHDIQFTDDIVIVTTQTAIRNLHSSTTDRTGTLWRTQLKQFVEAGADTGLFVVLDEAHHAPAYGCRNLLVSQDTDKPGIRTMLPGANLLGLTATPTYTDPARRGWLGKIFERGVIYEADQAALTMQRILARPNYHPRPTGREYTVDDLLYDRLVRQHRDLPEEVVSKLAEDSGRNDAIVADYVANKDEYGKTIIFADRWFQCVYLKEKLQQQDVRAEAIYSHIDADPGSAEARNQLTASENDAIVARFKEGPDDDGREKIEVLLNIRMLTEGADVPDVRTVFLTRQTTSRILLRQMIGRALRGPLAGGEEEANIIMFMDEWQRMIDWASPVDLDGGTEEGRMVRGYYPLEYVAIRLVEELVKHINNPDIPLPPHDRLMPVGWYETHFAVAEEEGEETETFTEYVMVYHSTQPKFEQLIDDLLVDCPAEWAREVLEREWQQEEFERLVSRYFDSDEDDIGGQLSVEIARVARHVAQKGFAPDFHSFEERKTHNIDELGHNTLVMTGLEADEFLRAEFEKPSLLWKTFFKSYGRFASAVDAAKRRILYERRHGAPASWAPPAQPADSRLDRRRELSEEEKEQVKQRDGYACLCCGSASKRYLQIDHIRPWQHGGLTTVSNSQTLCRICNKDKATNDINFLNQTETQLIAPKERKLLGPKSCPERALRRTVNFFYHCRAVCNIRMHVRSTGRYYRAWEIELFAGNDPSWLEAESDRLLRFIREDLGHPHVEELRIVGPT